MTLDVTGRAMRMQSSARKTLQYLLALIRKPHPGSNAAVERSIRDWGRIDERARDTVIEVDQMRLAYFKELFLRHGFSDREASIRAYAAYAMMMGDSMLKETVDLAGPVDVYVERFVDLLLCSPEADTAAREVERQDQ
ncbi:hypothetical protein [Bradyrhizobium sp. KB893862 SZCCT0404]|uniref:hypothetical protein n=1 Tax=Bradyrhizobium sp. KB893862 SZCCT0404 TaxID=2807672 RepID=UPI002013B97C|nr:hypothetical protein [Bradyrhizobium sp. KB893862 SZCCT0404]